MVNLEQKNQNYPITPETIKAYAKEIYTPIEKGECVTTIWVPMAGRRIVNKFIIDNPQLFETEFPSSKDYLQVYVEPLELTEESLQGYLRLLGVSLINQCRKKGCDGLAEFTEIEKVFGQETVSYLKLLETLKRLIAQTIESGNKIIFYLGEFDELTFANTIFYNNLRSLWEGFQKHLHFIFLLRSEVVDPVKVAVWGDFNEVILQNIVYVPLLSERDFDYLLDRLSKDLPHQITDEEKETIKKMCGGHPYMVKVAIKLISKIDGQKHNREELENLLVNYYELKSVAQGILEVYADKQRAILGKIANGQKISSIEMQTISTLLKLGIVIKNTSGEAELFGELFKQAVLGGSEIATVSLGGKTGLWLDEKSGEILLDGRTTEEKFTAQEYTVLKHFLENVNKLCSRDEVGEAIWGKNSYDKFSDWAIDQLMSKLRKKLKSISRERSLITIKGKGYKFINDIS